MEVSKSMYLALDSHHCTSIEHKFHLSAVGNGNIFFQESPTLLENNAVKIYGIQFLKLECRQARSRFEKRSRLCMMLL